MEIAGEKQLVAYDVFSHKNDILTGLQDINKYI